MRDSTVISVIVEMKVYCLTLPWSSHQESGAEGWLPPLSLNFNHCLSDLLLIVDLWTHPSSTRIQIKRCQYL